MNAWRTHMAAEVAALAAGVAVRLAGRLRAGARGCEIVDASGACALSAHAGLRADDVVCVTGVTAGGIVAVDRVEVLARALRSATGDAEHERLASPRLRDALAGCARLRAEVRAELGGLGFLEVETGTFTDEPGQEPHLEPLRLERPARYAITSPELRLKRLLGAGYERVFEIARVVRGGLGERSDRHHPEFTLLEWYRAYEADDALVADVERLLERGARALTGSATLRRDGRVAAVDRGCELVSVAQAFAVHAGVDLEPFLDGAFDAFRASARAAGMPGVRDDEDPEQLFFRILLDRVEPRLGVERPTVLHSYPASMAALARLHADDPRVARRFEVYVLGLELANGFVELTDPHEQRARFERERTVRARAGLAPLPWPEKFLAALERGMPPCAGIALGLDRLAMLILDEPRIDGVLAFPEPRDSLW